MVVTVPAARAGEAAAWALGQQRAGLVEEFGLVPATLEDAYVALVGGAGTVTPALATSLTAEEVRDDRAA
jgi:ABC-2 type transport system ATP-binding protein